MAETTGERPLWEVTPKRTDANPRWEFGLCVNRKRWGLGVGLRNHTWSLQDWYFPETRASYRELAFYLGPFICRLGRSGSR